MLFRSGVDHFKDIVISLSKVLTLPKNIDKYRFIYDNKKYIFDIGLKYIYSQASVLHLDSVKGLFEKIEIFLGEEKSKFLDYLLIFRKHIGIAEILKLYDITDYTYKNICKLSNLDKWKSFTKLISDLISEEIVSPNNNQYVLDLQSKMIDYYVKTINSNLKYYKKGSWNKCFNDAKKLQVNYFNYRNYVMKIIRRSLYWTS